MLARFGSTCGGCGFRIRKGERIARPAGGGAFQHAHCVGATRDDREIAQGIADAREVQFVQRYMGEGAAIELERRQAELAGEY
jgi:hypothetical protein